MSTNQQIFVIENVGLSTPVNINGVQQRRRVKNNTSRSFIDALVVLTALPSLTILALLLEANTRGNWLADSETRYTVFGLGFTLVMVCIAIAIYITSRIGSKMWSGAIPTEGTGRPAYSFYNPHLTVDEINDLPPSYEIVMGIDMAPPPYHSIGIDIKDSMMVASECPKYSEIIHHV